MSTLNVSNITDGTTTVGTSYVVNGSAKAWAYINHPSAVYRESFNTSSFTDLGTGKGLINLTNSMDTVNYSVTTAANAVSSGVSYVSAIMDFTYYYSRSVSSFPFSSTYAYQTSSSFYDMPYGHFAFQGDLA
jgi:uncharacterized membrane protein